MEARMLFGAFETEVTRLLQPHNLGDRQKPGELALRRIVPLGELILVAGHLTVPSLSRRRQLVL